MKWPNGPTFLDDCFEAYDEARHVKFYLGITSFLMFWLSIILDRLYLAEDKCRRIARLLAYGGSVCIVFCDHLSGLTRLPRSSTH